MSDLAAIEEAADMAYEANRGGEIKPAAIAELRRLLPAGDEGQAAA